MEEPNTYTAYALSRLASATMVKPYDPATPAESYSGSSGHRMATYDDAYKEAKGADADPSAQDLDPELVMIAGGGKKHGRYAIGCSAIPMTTPSLADIRARQTSSSPAIRSRDQPGRVEMEVSFFTFILFSVFTCSRSNDHEITMSMWLVAAPD